MTALRAYWDDGERCFYYALPRRFAEEHPDFDTGAIHPDLIFPASHGPECKGHPREQWGDYPDEWKWTYVRSPRVYFLDDPNTVRVTGRAANGEKYL